jgi:pyridoxamine 5'-phosphate oxidase
MNLLSEWFQAAVEAGEPLPQAMTLATSSSDGCPSARLVVMRGLDTGVVFFTDNESDKAAELRANPRAAAVWHWLAPRHRQVRLVGRAEKVSPDEADEYWRTRRPEVRLSAAVSVQSRVVASRQELEQRIEELARQYPDGVDLARPSRWGGYRLVPSRVEFWEEAADGLHDRWRYRRDGADWTRERLSP